MQSTPRPVDHFWRFWWVRSDAQLSYPQARDILVKIRRSIPFERNPTRWQTYSSAIDAVDQLHADRGVDVFPGTKLANLLRKAAELHGWDYVEKVGRRVPFPDDGTKPTLQCVRCGEVLPRALFKTRIDNKIEVDGVVLQPRGRLGAVKLRRTCAGCRVSVAARTRTAARSKLEKAIVKAHAQAPDRGTAFRAYEVLLQRNKRATAECLCAARRSKRSRETILFYEYKQKFLIEAERRLQRLADTAGDIPVKPLEQMSWLDVVEEPLRVRMLEVYDAVNQCRLWGRRPVLDVGFRRKKGAIDV